MGQPAPQRCVGLRWPDPKGCWCMDVVQALALAGQAVVEGAQGRRRVARWPWWHPAVFAVLGSGLVLSWLSRLAGLV